MNAKETTALAKAIPTKAASTARNELAPGDYSVDFTVRITGSMSVAEDQEYTPTTSLSVKVLAALAIAGRGATEEAFKAKMRGLMRLAVVHHNSTTIPWCLTKEDAEALSVYNEALVGYLDEGLKEVQEELAELPKKERKGAVRTKLVVARVEPELSTGKLRKAVLSNTQQELV